MAMTPPMQPGDTGADPAMDPGAAAPAQDDGSYVIEIRVSGNKEISVCLGDGAAEASEMPGGGDPDAGDYGASGSDSSIPVKSIKEALTLALEIYRHDGQMPQQADDQFQQGFKGANT